jgi:Mg-chelatase subunit ChlD
MQGREVTAADIDLIRAMLAAQPTRGRTPLSAELCRRWDWRKRASINNMVTS